MIAWTRFVLRHRGAILAGWLVVFVLGAAGAANLGGLLSNRFTVPGSDSDRGLNILKDRMGDRADGAFTLVVEGNTAQAISAARRAARVVPGAKAGPPLDAGNGVTYIQI
jgi:RND superfamily putative drug exporter